MSSYSTDTPNATGVLLSALTSILNDPTASNIEKDTARSLLNDPIGPGRCFGDGQPQPIPNNAKSNSGWDLVEAYEEGQQGPLDNSLSNPAVIVSLAAREILKRELDDGQTAGALPLRCIPENGGHNFAAAYPRLHDAAETIVRKDSRSFQSEFDAETVSNAHLVLYKLYIRSVQEASQSKSAPTTTMPAMDHLKKALNLSPTDWRLHSLLATENMVIYNTTLALEYLCRAEALAHDNDAALLDLAIRKAKVLFNLDRKDEVIETMQCVLSMYQSRKAKSISDRTVAHLAVAEYMLVQCYTLLGKNSKAVQHFWTADEKRNSIDKQVAITIDWGNRMLAQMMISKLNPNILSHGTCAACGELSDKSLTCSACKIAKYCSKDCQMMAWKFQGHRKECQKLKSERSQEKAQQKMDAKHRVVAKNLPPLDVHLGPALLWKEAVQLSQSGRYQDSAWKFLVALFMDAALDANDKEPARKAVNACESNDPVAMALSSALFCWDHEKPLQCAADILTQAMHMDASYDHCELAASIQDVDRKKFGLGCCHIMYARMLGKCFAVTSNAKAGDKTHRDAFEDAARLINESRHYIDPNRWLTLQFELGYSAMDIGAVTEAKPWLKRFTTTIGVLRAQNNGKFPSEHWKMLNAKAEQRLQTIPLMELAMKVAPGGFL